MNAQASMSNFILQVEHLSMKFGGLVAIGDLSFQARRGEITALIGPNGAGKTTVFNCITGFYKPTEGMITLNKRDGSTYLLERLPNHEIPARANVARTFQNIRLFSGMTLLENLLVAQHNKLMKASGYTFLGLFGFPSYRQASAESIELARHWLEKADLVDRADDPAGDLPYGAQRRLEIARAMCTGPELLCLDEPAAGLNPKESAALNELLMGIKSTGTSILLIEHDMSVVMKISDHVVVLEYGRKISDGNPQSVRTDPRVIAAYLGVDDEEVETVLTEVGDEDVIEQLDTGPDSAHGPGNSASMMAGPVSDTVEHADEGERVTVSKGASKAAQVDARAASIASKPAAKAPAKKATGKAPVKAVGISNRLDAPRGGKADSLIRIKGIGPVNEKKLNEHGIFHFDQIAAWKKADIEAAEAYLAFDGRIAREDWIGQAKMLAKEVAAKPATRGGRK
ncbi:ATP-binding cassette domain-containing protein [Mesorhizobium sp. VK9D]|uniref:ATP-binding cassette domain-containing protein n=1 Tax=Mesorhizobium australafricanum TaxID=3072311 RepID=UPI002A23A1A5|nr:ATP-binding cassette domain-containing protein [Mesorhizobium sp. VK9D]MDX8453404.1 ATP-binding cassette domain-containing protein [Mesorhizobium sp. VK9D]